MYRRCVQVLKSVMDPTREIASDMHFGGCLASGSGSTDATFNAHDDDVWILDVHEKRNLEEYSFK